MQIEHPKLVLTRIPQSWAWMRSDILVRLIPMAAVYGVAYRLTSGASWLGFSTGDLGVQLLFAAAASPAMFVAAAAVQRWLTRRRGALLVPADPGDAWLQTAYYALNGPLEEAFFRGLMQGGLGILWGTPAAFAVATLVFVVYHRLGRWTWADTVATALVGVPLGVAFWLLPGPPSLLGVSIAHFAATCGFLGPGPYLLKKLGRL